MTEFSQKKTQNRVFIQNGHATGFDPLGRVGTVEITFPLVVVSFFAFNLTGKNEHIDLPEHPVHFSVQDDRNPPGFLMTGKTSAF